MCLADLRIGILRVFSVSVTITDTRMNNFKLYVRFIN